MAQQIVNVGAAANDGTGDTLRASQQKANANFTELYGSKLDSVVAGSNITVDNTDPLNPIIASTGGGGGGDMLKSVYDTDDDGIVDSAKKEIVQFINKSGSTITKGTIVYLKSTSSSTSYPEVLKANASTEATSSKTIGAVFEDVANDATGYLVTSGEVRNLDTSAYSIGDKLWLSTTDGLVTTTAPTQPNHTVFIGTVTRSQSVNGRILYAIQNGFELGELHNVLIPTPSDNDLLIYESATSLWKNKTITTSMLPSGIDVSKIDGGNVSNTEFSYLDGVTSSIQTQIDSKSDINPRVQTITSSATVTPTSTNDLVVITAQAVGLTIANPTGTMVQGQALMIRIKDNGTARTIAYGTNYRALGITLPTTTVISKTLYLGCIWNATDTKFDVVGLNQEA